MGTHMAVITDQARIREFKRMLDRAERVVMFTGAGISTESGIPDFRSPGGVWTKYKPIMYQEFITSEAARRESWRRKFDDSYGFSGAEPNRGHRAIEKLVRDGKVSAVITQNTDGLHQVSGVPDDRVIELHGNTNEGDVDREADHHDPGDQDKVGENGQDRAVFDHRSVLDLALDIAELNHRQRHHDDHQDHRLGRRAA